MSNVENILGISLGGTSILGLVAYLLYSWSKGNCASHMRVGDTELTIDINQVQEILKEASSPEERDKIRKEVQAEFTQTLHKVKSRLVNKLDQIKIRNHKSQNELV